jgi:protein-disulfide isomerase
MGDASLRVSLPVVLCSVLCTVAVAQSAPTTPPAVPSKATSTTARAQTSKTEAKTETTKTSAASKTVKAESVTINMPEGMTHDQADAILNELKAIHQLLVAQAPTKAAAAPANTAPAAAPSTDKVQLKMASGWHWMGRDDAPVTIVEFTDYQCPFCRKYHTETFAQLKKNYIDTGKVRFASRDLPLSIHPYAQKAAEAARCAGEQDKFWELRDAMITNSADLSQDAIIKYAQTNALDIPSFKACAEADRYKAEIQKDMADAGTLGISGTPSFIIGKTTKDAIEGDRVVGALPVSAFENEIQKFMVK